MNRLELVRWSTSVCVVLTAFVVHSDGAGLILKKERPWSTTVSEVLPFTSERARGYNDSGYKSYFIGADGKTLAVESSLIVSLVVFPDPNEFQNITSEASLSDLQSKKAELQDVAAKYPQARQYLASPIGFLDAEITRFRSGERKLNGKWLTAAEYQRIQDDAAGAEAAAQARIAAAKAAEEQRRAEEQRIQEQRRAEEQRAQEQRRAEEQRIQEQLRAEERALAEKRAEEQAAADRRAAEEEREAQANVQKAVAAFETAERRAAENYQTARHGKLSGQVFVSTRGGENFKLGGVQVALFARDAIDTLMTGVQKYALFKTDFSGDFYFRFLGHPLQSVETDADGRFLMKVPIKGSFVIAARAKRSVGEWTERYYWLAPVSLEGQPERSQNLSNNNLTSAPNTPSLISTKD